MHFLITGHTGFKGTWMMAMLQRMGHQVSGVALPPEQGSLFALTSFDKKLVQNFFLDIRNFNELQKSFQSTNPDVLVHLAAQSLVGVGYSNPVLTYETNVMGTLNVLRASRSISNLKAILIVSTDKVYRIDPNQINFNEEAPLGAADPYATSKAMADLLSQSWKLNNLHTPLAIARGGNVIGGGDFSQDRLLPDLYRSIIRGEKLGVRNPDATRPWQHVLDCLAGYIQIISNMQDRNKEFIWNVGPSHNTALTVREVCEIFKDSWGMDSLDFFQAESLIHETKQLSIDTRLIENEIGYANRMSSLEAINKAAKWYKGYAKGVSAQILTENDVDEYLHA
jgi:CDP-glucose 4,6-dehydratase